MPDASLKRTEPASADAGRASVLGPRQIIISIPALCARGLIRLYRYTLSSLVGRTCRHLPTCSEYTETAIARFGLWAGGWMGLARFSRCRPGGSHGFDPVPEILPAEARWYRPWRYGFWGSSLSHRA